MTNAMNSSGIYESTLGWWAVYGLLVLAAFLSGSVPWALVVGKVVRGVDVRELGSRNIGATNAVRVLGRPLGFTVFVLDALKGTAPVLGAGWWLGTLTRWYSSAEPQPWLTWAWLVVVVAAVLGHVFSPWVRFKGGKGVATGFGSLAGVWPTVTLAALGALVLWLLLARTTRYVSVASMAASAALAALIYAIPALTGVDNPLGRVWPELLVASVLVCLVIIKHRPNIARLRAGTEPRIGQRVASPR